MGHFSQERVEFGFRARKETFDGLRSQEGRDVLVDLYFEVVVIHGNFFLHWRNV